jgi:hypothetical protein
MFTPMEGETACRNNVAQQSDGFLAMPRAVVAPLVRLVGDRASFDAARALVDHVLSHMA